MEIYKYDKKISRDKYKKIQIARSKLKYQYCRVSVLDTIQKINVIHNNHYENGPIICLGVRNAREINLFKIAKNRFLSKLFYLIEIKRHGFSSLMPSVENIFPKSDINNIQDGGVYGVELNPDTNRKDVFVGSFDDMPESYDSRFGIVYSNSFDQSINPDKTAREWMRIVKDKGYIAIDWVEDDDPTYTDPVGMLSKDDILTLFDGKVVQYSKNGNFDTQGVSSSIIIQVSK